MLTALAGGGIILHGIRGRMDRVSPSETGSTGAEPVRVHVPMPARLVLGFPTPQTGLLDLPPESVFMPTASGRIESALYGSNRTGNQGGRILPTFHEGIDIAPLTRDRQGRPLDPIFAVADGRVAYLQRHPGNSNYGVYVVLVHEDPLGEIYTLYAHLSQIAAHLREGDPVRKGETIGRMGNTPASLIPLSRAHLHFEIGMIQNMRFAEWYRRQREKPDHGNWHGANLSGVDPLLVFRFREPDESFSMSAVLESIPMAFELVCRPGRFPDYFVRYGRLWKGRPWREGEPVVLQVCAGGVVLAGRSADEEERRALGTETARVIRVDEEVLGRNGRRLIVRDGTGWRLSEAGRRWLDAFLF